MMQIVSLVGAAIVMFAYTMLQIEKWTQTTRAYLVMNLVGAVMLFCAAATHRDVGFMLLNFFWAVMTVTAWCRSR